MIMVKIIQTAQRMVRTISSILRNLFLTLHSWFSSLVSKNPTANNSDNDKEEEEEKKKRKRKNKNNPTTVVTMSGFTKWWNTHGPIWALKRQETKLFKQEAIEALEKMDGAKKGSCLKLQKQFI